VLEVERFKVEGSTLVVVCTSCGAENVSRAAAHTALSAQASYGLPMREPAAAPPVAAAAASASSAANVVALRTPTVEAIARAAASTTQKPFDVPPGHCPKCISRRAPDALACPSCGLTFSTAEENAFAPSAWLESEWLKLLNSWGDDAQHEALRIAAMNQSELAQLGRLYRLRLADLPTDPYATRGRDEVLRLAVLPSVTSRQMKQEPQTPVWKYVALTVIILGCLVALFVLVRQMLSLSS
jgi:hypothetical protein